MKTETSAGRRASGDACSLQKQRLRCPPGQQNGPWQARRFWPTLGTCAAQLWAKLSPGVCPLSPPAPPVKITAQRFQRKTSITAPRSGFLFLVLFVFYISVHFSLTVGSQAQRDREVTERTSKGPAEPLQASVYIHVPAVLRAGTAYGEAAGTRNKDTGGS